MAMRADFASAVAPPPNRRSGLQSPESLWAAGSAGAELALAMGPTGGVLKGEKWAGLEAKPSTSP